MFSMMPTVPSRFRIAPETYRRITVFALWALAVIVVTGGAVRLTGSGLGCSDWPNCEENQLVPDLEFHAMVEFTNRVVTGLVSAAVALAVLGSFLRWPRRSDLTWWSMGLVVGVAVQVALGALVVGSHLSPWLVSAHFLVSMLLVLNAVVLRHRAGMADSSLNLREGERRATSPWLRRCSASLAVAAAAALFTGTLLTGAGPHGGDENAPRFDLHIPSLARWHGAAMVITSALGVVVWALAERGSGNWRHRVRSNSAPAARAVLLFVAIQAFVGYTQYFTGVPALLVGIHITGAMLLWAAVIQLNLSVATEMRSAPGKPLTAPKKETPASV